jgi:predicted transcriptional regulator
MKDSDCDIVLCDIMVRKYLPAMRAEMVLRLVRNEGISQSDAARKLGITRAAVSQYLSGKRGDAKVVISHELETLFDRWALSLAGSDMRITLCDICRCAVKRA